MNYISVLYYISLFLSPKVSFPFSEWEKTVSWLLETCSTSFISLLLDSETLCSRHRMMTEDQSNNKPQQHKLKQQFTVLAGGEKFLQDFPSYINGLVKCDPGGYVTMSEYPSGAQKIYNFQPRAGDVFVNTFPKSGK